MAGVRRVSKVPICWLAHSQRIANAVPPATAGVRSLDVQRNGASCRDCDLWCWLQTAGAGRTANSAVVASSAGAPKLK